MVGAKPDAAADVVDQHVDPAEFVSGPLDRRCGTFPGFQVRGDRDGVAAGGRDPRGFLIHQFRPVDEGHLSPLRGDPPGHRLPDPLRGAGDHDGLAFEPAAAEPLWQHAGAALIQGAAHGLLRPIGVLGYQPSCGVPVTGLERRYNIEMVRRDTRIAPRRVAQHLVHPALDPEVVVGLQQMLVAGHVEQVVVEGRVGVGVGRSVDEVLALHIWHR